MDTPDGLNGITELFGDIQPFIQGDGTLSQEWHDLHMSKCPLPFSLPLDWNRSISVNFLLCHKKMVEVFTKVFDALVERGLQSQVKTYGGCFAYRPQRGSLHLSTHAWGIAVDLNPFENQLGTAGNMNQGVIDVFKGAGFTWGGDFRSRKDPMHFQFARGY